MLSCVLYFSPNPQTVLNRWKTVLWFDWLPQRQTEGCGEKVKPVSTFFTAAKADRPHSNEWQNLSFSLDNLIWSKHSLTGGLAAWVTDSPPLKHIRLSVVQWLQRMAKVTSHYRTVNTVSLNQIFLNFLGKKVTMSITSIWSLCQK